MRALLLIGVLAGALSTSASAQAVDGKEVYDRLCKKCHGATGVPTKVMATKFPKMLAFNNDKASTTKGTAADVVSILTKGKGQDMKSFKEKMKPEEMAAVAKYVLELAKTKP